MSPGRQWLPVRRRSLTRLDSPAIRANFHGKRLKGKPRFPDALLREAGRRTGPFDEEMGALPTVWQPGFPLDFSIKEFGPDPILDYARRGRHAPSEDSPGLVMI